MDQTPHVALYPSPVQIFLILSLSLSSLRDALESLLATTRLVVDPFSIDAIDVAMKLHVSPYLFFTSSAMCLSFSFYLPKLDEEVSCEFRDLPEPVEIPGSVPVHGRDLLDPVQDRSGEPYKKILHNVKRFNLAEGVIVNSFMELEGRAIRALQGEEPDRPPVYVIGPLIGSSNEPERSECLQWLDSQPGGSGCSCHLEVVGHFLKIELMNLNEWPKVHMGYQKSK
ncbi:hypothetical protein RJ639_001770 [Escallonia herrerae]|uniref:Uncharacterized protein n=1 Tax=Escallonia herrerae TaxID=1293975 RepID=A0AA88XG16_9ASTE|nr:hypothetical protein RJ639_001770 [Escallonia herrerae]